MFYLYISLDNAEQSQKVEMTFQVQLLHFMYYETSGKSSHSYDSLLICKEVKANQTSGYINQKYQGILGIRYNLSKTQYANKIYLPKWRLGTSHKCWGPTFSFSNELLGLEFHLWISLSKLER